MAEINLPRDVALQAYREAGGWSRHYSSIRAAVPTFLFGVAVAILQQSWESPAWDYFWGALCATVGALLFMGLFTLLANRDREYQKDLFTKLQVKIPGQQETVFTPKPYPERPDSIFVWKRLWDGAWWLSIILTAILGYFIYLYHDMLKERGS